MHVAVPRLERRRRMIALPKLLTVDYSKLRVESGIQKTTLKGAYFTKIFGLNLPKGKFCSLQINHININTVFGLEMLFPTFLLYTCNEEAYIIDSTTNTSTLLTGF